MKIKPLLIIIAGSLTSILFSCCSNINYNNGDNNIDSLNISHLIHLYTKIILPCESEVGVIHIYSEYPDYNFVIEPDEGFTCIDDVARAIVLIANSHNDPDNKTIKEMHALMPEFILNMQADNGYFYNFLRKNKTINKTYPTSIPEPNWWSWRAFLALESYPASWHTTAPRAQEAINKLVHNILNEYLNKPLKFKTIEGIKLPAWLPHETAADQTGILIIALVKYYQRTQQEEALTLIEKFAEGLLHMQKGDSSSFPYGAYLSWNNIWHAYGNIQAYAMLKTGQLLGRDDFIHSALLEIDHFYPYLITQNYLNYFIIKYNNIDYEIIEMEQFPQIAYGIRPMVFACLEAYDVTGKDKYLKMAEQIASWFTGKNPAGKIMFDHNTGRCYDGIMSPDDINLNSGAESTIEALLTMQAILNHPEINHTNIYETH